MLFRSRSQSSKTSKQNSNICSRKTGIARKPPHKSNSHCGKEYRHKRVLKVASCSYPKIKLVRVPKLWENKQLKPLRIHFNPQVRVARIQAPPKLTHSPDMVKRKILDKVFGRKVKVYTKNEVDILLQQIGRAHV